VRLGPAGAAAIAEGLVLGGHQVAVAVFVERGLGSVAQVRLGLPAS
jgi:hypothetical protein